MRLRFPVVGGPGDPTGRYAGYVGRIHAGQPIPLIDGGFNSFRHVFIGDVARAVRAAVETPAASGGYNVAGREIVSVRDLVGLIGETLGRPEPRVVSPPSGGPDREELTGLFAPFSSRRDQILDPARAARELGFLATPLSVWLPRTVEWCMNMGAGPGDAAELELIENFRQARPVA